MRFAKFIGTNPQNIGRFGIVQPGQILKVTLAEAIHLEGMPEFSEPAPEEISEEENKIVPLAPDRKIRFPKKNNGFPIQNIPWDGPLAKYLQRVSKPDLLKILRSMKGVGVPVEANADWTKEFLADAVHTASVRAGWTEPGARLGAEEAPSEDSPPE